MACVEFVDAGLFGVEAGDMELLAEFDGKRQAYIAHADDADADADVGGVEGQGRGGRKVAKE